MSKQLIANIASKENLLRYVSHELRSPLTRLQLAAGIAFKKNQQNHELLNRVELEIKRMNYLIQQIMEFSRLKTHRENLKKTVIHLDIWLKQLIQDCEFEANHQDKNICLSIDKSDIFINANSDLLASACENIIRNAINHTPKRTTVTIIVNATNDYVDIIIKDQGAGIPEHIIDKVFEPFITTGSNKQNISGFGLGMCIAKEAIELHNGEILITNLVSGCQVILRLPI